MEVHDILFISTKQPWTGAPQEVQRVMDALDIEDAEFLLSEFQNFARCIKSLRKPVT